MRVKRTSATACAVASLAVAAFAAPAGASISEGYCAASLRGYTGQAPDNDIRTVWDYFQSQGYNIVSSSDNPYGWLFWPTVTANVSWRFNSSNRGTVYANFRCYWDATNVYRDGPY